MKRTAATTQNASPEFRRLALSRLASHRIISIGLGAVVLCCVAFAAGRMSAPPPAGLQQEVEAMKLDILMQQHQVDRMRLDNENTVNALSARLAELQAASTRLDALGSRLAQMGQLSLEEFNFGEPAAQGGASQLDSLGPYSEADLRVEILQLSDKLRRQASQLDALQSLMANRQLEAEFTPAGWPVRKGWVSSGYGERSDPLTGERSMHRGYDFSGTPGTDVLSVASGVVTWAGPRATYGNTVEIDHGNGYVTRYAHNRELAVKPGDRVTAGQLIAQLGSTGRASGPHVHFEVLKDGGRINPSRFVKQLR